MVSRRKGEPEILLRLRLGDGILGPGKIEILARIERLGSISAVARDMKMSYRQAWMLVETMNRKFRDPLVTTSRGGRRGGGARLTASGREVVSCYRSMLGRVERVVAGDLGKIAAMIEPE